MRRDDRHSWIDLLYCYSAAFFGLLFATVGGYFALHGLAESAVPELWVEADWLTRDEARHDGLREALEGGAAVAAGAPVLWWHLAEARRRPGP